MDDDIAKDWKNYVSKPIFGREGAGIYMGSNYSSSSLFESATDRAFGRASNLGKSIYQKFERMAVVQARTY